MRIAVWYHLPAGGAKRALHDQVTGLVKRGHAVEVWMPACADREFLPLPDSIPQHVLPLSWNPPGTGRLARWARPARHAAKLRAARAHAREVAVASAGFDILFAHSCAWYAAPHVARSSTVPCAVYLHEPMRALHEAGDGAPVWFGPAAPSARSGFLGRMNEVLEYWRDLLWQRAAAREEWRNARAATTLLVNSWFSSESAMRVYGRRGTVCELGVDTDSWTDTGIERELLVVGLGAIAPHKGVADAVESMRRLPDGTRRSSRLLWFGQKADPEYQSRIRDLARDAGVVLDLRVAAPEAEVRDALRRASVFLFPSRLEPFGYAPLEAAACGCPTVAVREGGPRETILDGRTGILTDGTPGEMAGALGRLLADPSLVREMGRSARGWALERWSLGASIDRLEAALTRTLELR